MRIIAPGRFLEYVSAFNPNALHSIATKVDKTAWSKFKNGQPRKLAIRIANPDSLDELSGTAKAASTGIKAMAEAYDAPYVTVEISMGNRKGALSTVVVEMAKNFRSWLVMPM